jgi:hypothetical protein
MPDEIAIPRLPRQVEDNPVAASLLQILKARPRQLWDESAIHVPTLELSSPLGQALRHVGRAQLVVRGLEGATKTLTDEARGLEIAEAKSETPRSPRVSRLLLLANDGTRRFYRQVETLIKYHGDRLLVLVLDADEATFGECVFGANAVARAALVTKKSAVADILIACVTPAREPSEVWAMATKVKAERGEE